jgi:hypothetical protein
MKRIIKLTESDLRKIIKRVLKEQYNDESMASVIVDKLLEAGMPDQYAEFALVDLIEIEQIADNNEKKQLVSDFKSEINRVLNKFNVGRYITDPEKIRDFERKIRTVDILLDNLYRKIDSEINLN